MINIKLFDTNKFKINEISYRSILIYYIGYTTVKNRDLVRLKTNNSENYIEKYMKIKF